MNITLDHPFCTTKQQVAKLCKPLFTHTPFQYFDYQQYYFDGSYVTLGINGDYFCEIFNNKLLPDMEEIQNNTSHYLFFSPVLLPPETLEHGNKFTDNLTLSNKFNIYHRLYLGFNTPHCVETFGFGLTQPVRNVTEVYMNHTLLLEKFCVYFREAARTLINQMRKTKLRFDHVPDPIFFKDIDFKNTQAYTEFLKDIKLKNYHLQGRQGECELSEREFECLLWSAKNKTAKQIAKLLSLSSRTIEAYFVTLKNKMGCDSKAELIELAFKNPIIKTFID